MAPSLMLQGTSSHVGKSLLVAALCRILREEGFSVAPFKAQNMALNSFVTREGGEIGRAQAFQAYCAGVEPTVDMNPILLKPSHDSISQVVIHGKVHGNMTALEYHRFKREAKSYVLESYRRLERAFDVILIEGAGSPAEVNLRDGDIVNMGLALEVGSPVLLVGDIERGGVFASLLGTMELLSPEERGLVKGLVINKFRGDTSLLEPGVRFLEERLERPVLGVVPYIKDLNLPEEDGVAIDEVKREEGVLRIGVIRLPRISNFTDFDPLRMEPDVGLTYVDDPDDLPSFHCIIIPGTKNTLSDLSYIRKKGLEGPLRVFAERGGLVLGICGGYQILGEWIEDPSGVEGRPGRARGLGLLRVRTTMKGEKRLHRVRGRLAGDHAIPVEGYEIHMGETESMESPLFLIERDGSSAAVAEGALSERGNIMGTYIHGLFEGDHFRRWFLDRIRSGTGLRGGDRGVYRERVEEGIGRLCREVRRHLRMEEIYRIMGL